MTDFGKRAPQTSDERRAAFVATFEVKGELIAADIWNRMGLGARDRYELDLLELEALIARGYADGYRDGYLAGVEAARKLWTSHLDNLLGRP